MLVALYSKHNLLCHWMNRKVPLLSEIIIIIFFRPVGHKYPDCAHLCWINIKVPPLWPLSKGGNKDGLCVFENYATLQPRKGLGAPAKLNGTCTEI